jgi:molybdate transport system regulatory protein
MSAPEHLIAALSLRRGEGGRVGPDRIALLQAIGELGSIRAAADRAGLSYKAAWDAVQALNNLFDAPLVASRAGGRHGGAAALTPRGTAVLGAFQRLEGALAEAAASLERALSETPADDLTGLFWSFGMKTSARNALRGVVTHVADGAVNAEVTLKVSDRVKIVAVVTRDSVAELRLEPGRPAVALIKSSFIVLAKGEGLVTSARNQIDGRVLERHDGPVSCEITLQIAEGKTLTATITRESADRLDLRPGEPVTALVKAPHVILAVE